MPNCSDIFPPMDSGAYRDARDEQIERLQNENARLRRASLGSVDRFTLVIVVLGAAWVGVQGPWMGRPFRELYHDFGAQASLPALTRWALASWLSPVLAIVPAGLSLYAAVGRSLRTRRGAIIAGFLYCALVSTLYWYAQRLPIWQTASQIR
jgi:hypothetical protein